MPKAVKVYINPKPLLLATERAAARVLVRQGAYVRTAMRRRIKFNGTGKPSARGRPPNTHNLLLKNSIFWALDRTRESVVVGPNKRRAGIIGRTHEFGGTETDNQIPAKRKNMRVGFVIGGKRIRANWNMHVGGHGPIAIDQGIVRFTKFKSERQVARSRRIALQADAMITGRRLGHKKARRYPKRPFAKPALLAAVSNGALTRMWRNQIGPSGSIQGVGRLA